MTADVKGPSSNIRTIILTGIVSLVVGVGSGLLINYFTEKRPALVYEITTQEVFAGEQHNIGIFALRIRNSGKKEIEQTSAELHFQEGSITERRVAGISDQARSLGGSDRAVIVNIPFLNPQEQFSIQVLLANVKAPLDRPTIEVRGKGIKGIESSPETPVDSTTTKILSALSAAAGTLAAATGIFLSRRHRRLSRDLVGLPEFLGGDSGLHSGGDQRDAVAFALDGFNLGEDAKVIRSWPRELSYWAASDILTASWIQKADRDTAKGGLEALAFLMESAAISSDSRRIISLNACRLALLIGDRDAAKEHLLKARSAKEVFVEKRISLFPELVSLSKELDRALMLVS
jgi:hypothetical protein